jgi:hypothetical protein
VPASPSASNTISVALVETRYADRFKIPADSCDVVNKEKLVQYRAKYTEWMKWYEHTDSEPNSIERQINVMLFNDLTYRAITSVRSAATAEVPISAVSGTLAYLLDHGYVVSQVLAIQKLLDRRSDVISVKRLLKSIEKHRALITREIYVAGDGVPYDYESWGQGVDRSDPMVQMWGIDAPGLMRFAISRGRHQRFDLLCGKQPDQRTREDTMPRSIFRTLDTWISGPSAREIGQLRNTFIAHSADEAQRGSAQFKGVALSQIDDLQRAIVRVERALTDRVGRGQRGSSAASTWDLQPPGGAVWPSRRREFNASSLGRAERGSQRVGAGYS